MNKIQEKLFNIQTLNLTLYKDSMNPHFKKKYVSYNSILNTLKVELNKLKLLQRFKLEVIENKQVLSLVLTDIESFESISSSVIIDYTKGPQQIGSQITYYKRYLTEAVFCLPISDESDDDGEGAEKEWLNDKSPEWQQLGKDFGDGKITTISEIRKKFKVSKQVEEILLSKGFKK